MNLLVANPKEGITKAEAVATQNLVIDRNLFASTGGDLVSAGDPVILISDTAALA